MLTDTKIKALRAKHKPYKMSDCHGLYIYVTKNGGKYWRQKYRINGKEKLLSHGEYPFITLSQARQLRDVARTQVKQGIDPAIEKRAQKTNKLNTFENIARDWHEAQKDDWSKNNAQKVIISLEKDIFPSLGNVPIGDITTPLLLQALKAIEARGAYEQAKRVSQRCDAVFKFAIASGLLTYNPAQEIQGALKKPRKRNYNSINAKELPAFLDALAAVNAHPIVKLAAEMLMLCFTRTSELIEAEWSEVDFEQGLWEVPANRMKGGRAHIVPLSNRVLEILEELKRYNGHRQHVFASPNKPRNPLSNNAILQLLKRMGYAGKMTGHGFRHLASTTLNEMGYNPDVIEKQLAHSDNSTRGVYNKAEYLDDRRKLMQEWSNFVMHSNSSVVPFQKIN
ncbi:MAG: tyrosine-type recombinase/integrase [Gammaproteobacteria bacterium]|nr:tyrosine-type recombinase/integrase [Gammaproteobacteria bacterium]